MDRTKTLRTLCRAQKSLLDYSDLLTQATTADILPKENLQSQLDEVSSLIDDLIELEVDVRFQNARTVQCPNEPYLIPLPIQSATTATR